MAESLIVNERHPLLIVDWSPINGNEIFQLLRVSIPMGGRVLTIYEKTYEESELNTGATHQALLDSIQYCLPEVCRPLNMGWHRGCRVRGNVKLSIDGEKWQRSSEWFPSANGKAVA